MELKKTAAGWATVSEAAAFLGITPQGVRASYLPAMDAESVDRKSKPMRLYVPAAIEVAVERRLAERRPEEALLAGGDSPALERYRLAKAKHAELDLALRKEEVIDRARCRDILQQWATIIRRMGESLGRQHGNGIASLFLDALDECRVVVSELEPSSEAATE